jgi:tetratricopeptide (TPR) repeat protein
MRARANPNDEPSELRTRETSSRCSAARTVAVEFAQVLGLGAVLGVVITGCVTPQRKQPTVLPSRAEAEAATLAGDWRKAAERWYALYCADPGKPADACAEASRAFLELKDAESASNLLDAGLAAHEEEPELLELKGEALVALGFRRAAEVCFERSLAIDPRRVPALVHLGELRIELGLESSAVKPLRRAVEITGGDFQTWRLLARAERESGEPRRAFESWVRAFKMGEGSVEDLVEAATLFVDESFRRAHPEAGEQMRGWLATAIERDPQCTRAHFQLGLLAEETGKPDEAIAHYRRALEIDPSCLMSLTNLAIVYSNAGEETGARDMVARALVLEQDGTRRKALLRLLEPFDKKPKTAKNP